jgi:O-antigen/teichoic acid export membrane protein
LEIKIKRAIKILQSLLDQAAQLGSIFFVNIYLARNTDQSDYGRFVLAYSGITLLIGLQNASLLDVYSVYANGRYKNKFLEYIKLIERKNIILIYILLIILSFGYLFLNINYRSILISIILVLPLIIISSFIKKVFYTNGNLNEILIASIMSMLCIILGLCGLKNMELLNCSSAILVVFLSWAFYIPMYYFKYNTNLININTSSIDKEYWNNYWKYSKWILLISLVFQIMNQGYYWILSILSNEGGIANLKAVQNIAQPITLLSISISSIMLPFATKRFNQSGIGGLNIVVKKAFFYFGVFSILYWFICLKYGNDILILIYKGKYQNKESIVSIILFAPLIMGFGNILNDALKSMESSKHIFIAYTLSGLVTLTFGVLLVIQLGVFGAAIGMVLSAAVYSSTLLYFYLVSERILND